MRTTLDIQDDLLQKLKTLAHKRRVSLRQLVDELIRRGLTSQTLKAKRGQPYRVMTFQSKFKPGADPQRLNQLADELEVEALVSRAR